MGIRDVARLAGVSIATVSRALNSPETTSKETREKVLNIIKKYDYIPNQEAKNLFSGSSNSIALFIFDMANPFYISLIKHLNRIAFEHNYTLLICDAEDDYEKEIKYYEYCRSVRTSGIIYTCGSSRDTVANQNGKSNIPVVVIDRSTFKDHPCYVVQSDHAKGMQLAIEYLFKLNHRKIGYITGTPNIISSEQRLNDFLASMKKFDLEIPQDYILQGSFSVNCGIAAFDYFYSLSEAPTAIITADDQIARGFIMRANSLGVSIPDEFSVCGMDGVDDVIFYPPITSIKQDIQKIAEAAFEFIINHDTVPPPQEKLIEVSINIGQTCHKI
jgi:DNA-binding LacI/PurR family transcriptional regulator